MRMAVDYSSAVNTVVPAKLIPRVRILGLSLSRCYRILDVLMGRAQVVRLGGLTLSTAAPAGCV